MLETALLSFLPSIFMLLILGGLIAFIVWYLKAFYSAREKKQKNAEEQRARHGGKSVLEWPGRYAEGEPDREFGRLIVMVMKKRGNGGACFYEEGLVIDNKRLPYSEIKDIVYSPATAGKRITLKEAVRDTGVMWIYPKKGSTIGLRGLTYRLDNETMENIKKGLGFTV
ncbi:hypothetical protein [Anaerotruncus colihominis]|uniref:hypothetical protein n=1 Tax=Anaerotruncus colihominis TaxID=169435 RepID=UPI001896B88D|nr:hypothetical protein [Anaerotruncus colihominis]